MPKSRSIKRRLTNAVRGATGQVKKAKKEEAPAPAPYNFRADPKQTVQFDSATVDRHLNGTAPIDYIYREAIIFLEPYLHDNSDEKLGGFPNAASFYQQMMTSLQSKFDQKFPMCSVRNIPDQGILVRWYLASLCNGDNPNKMKALTAPALGANTLASTLKRCKGGKMTDNADYAYAKLPFQFGQSEDLLKKDLFAYYKVDEDDKVFADAKASLQANPAKLYQTIDDFDQFVKDFHNFERISQYVPEEENNDDNASQGSAEFIFDDIEDLQEQLEQDMNHIFNNAEFNLELYQYMFAHPFIKANPQLKWVVHAIHSDMQIRMKFFAAVNQGLTCYDWAKFALFNGKGKGYLTPDLKKQLDTLKQSPQYKRMDPKKQTVACYDTIPEISKQEFEQNSANWV